MEHGGQRSRLKELAVPDVSLSKGIVQAAQCKLLLSEVVDFFVLRDPTWVQWQGKMIW